MARRTYITPTARRVSAKLRHRYPVSNSTPCVSGTASPLSRISFEPRNLNKIFSIRSSWRFLSESVNRRHSFYRRTSRRREVYCTVAIAVAVSPPNGNPLNKSLRSAFWPEMSFISVKCQRFCTTCTVCCARLHAMSLLAWRRKHQVSPKRRCMSNKERVAASLQWILIFTVMRASNCADHCPYFEANTVWWLHPTAIYGACFRFLAEYEAGNLLECRHFNTFCHGRECCVSFHRT